jgi:hypothetical protein
VRERRSQRPPARDAGRCRGGQCTPWRCAELSCPEGRHARRRQRPVDAALRSHADGVLVRALLQQRPERHAVVRQFPTRSRSCPFCLRCAGLRGDSQRTIEASHHHHVQLRRPHSLDGSRRVRRRGRRLSGRADRTRTARGYGGALARLPPTRHARRDLGGNFRLAHLRQIEGARLLRRRFTAPFLIHDPRSPPTRTNQDSPTSIPRGRSGNPEQQMAPPV